MKKDDSMGYIKFLVIPKHRVVNYIINGIRDCLPNKNVFKNTAVFLSGLSSNLLIF